MSTEHDGPAAWLRKRWFPVGLTIVVIFGYQFGKDIALSHNKLDAIQQPAANGR